MVVVMGWWQCDNYGGGGGVGDDNIGEYNEFIVQGKYFSFLYEVKIF
jgi:hypothetical protein